MNHDKYLGRHRRGMTLIELMVVVAIIAVLAAIGGTAYTQYISQGKITKLKQLALEVEQGQRQYASRNSTYLTPSNNPYVPGSSSDWENLLGFNHEELKNTTDVRTEGGNSSASCSSDTCGSNFNPDGKGTTWYAVRVSADLDPSSSKKTAVYLDQTLEQPIVLNEGE